MKNSTYYIFNSNIMDAELPLFWQGKIYVFPRTTDADCYRKYFDSFSIKRKTYNRCMKKAIPIPSVYLRFETKQKIKNFILNDKHFSFSWDVPLWEMKIECVLDGAKVDFNNLDRESKEIILDSILFEKVTSGNFKIPVEIINEDDDEQEYPCRVHPPYYTEIPEESPLSENLQILEKYCYNTTGSIKSKKKTTVNDVA